MIEIIKGKQSVAVIFIPDDTEQEPVNLEEVIKEIPEDVTPIGEWAG